MGEWANGEIRGYVALAVLRGVFQLPCFPHIYPKTLEVLYVLLLSKCLNWLARTIGVPPCFCISVNTTNQVTAAGDIQPRGQRWYDTKTVHATHTSLNGRSEITDAGQQVSNPLQSSNACILFVLRLRICSLREGSFEEYLHPNALNHVHLSKTFRNLVILSEMRIQK